MPRRSTGCERCRQRKVRCDDARPQCQRCADYGALCPGYRPPPEKDLKFVQAVLSAHSTNKCGGTQHDRPVNRSLKWREQVFRTDQTTVSNHVDNRSMHRVQLLSTFLDLYLPKRSARNLTASYSYISSLPSIDLSTPLLQISVDTLCLLEIGSLYENDSLVQESRMRYVRALAMLARELAKPKPRRMHSDHVLAVIVVLGLCELFDAISNSGELGDPGRGFASHVNGAEQFIVAIGPEIFATPLGRLLFQNVRHGSACLGMARRKAVVFGEVRWLSLTSETAATDPTVALYDILVQMPRVFERADALVVADGQFDDNGEVVQQCATLRNLLSSWQDKWIDQERCYSIVNVQDMTEFTALVSDRTFQTVFDFASAQQCLHMQLYWLACLLLDKTLLDLQHIAEDYEAQPLRSISDIERDIYVSSTSLTRTIPFCCLPEVASVGRIGTFLIRTVERYFQDAGHCPEFEWCRAVRTVFSTPKPSRCDKISSIGEKMRSKAKPWEIKHSCKSKICNFRIECLAPAPLSLEGHYPTTTYVPRGRAGEAEIVAAKSTAKADCKGIAVPSQYSMRNV